MRVPRPYLDVQNQVQECLATIAWQPTKTKSLKSSIGRDRDLAVTSPVFIEHGVTPITSWILTAPIMRLARTNTYLTGPTAEILAAYLDLGYGDYDLCYWRDQQKRELDFVVTLNRMPIALVECKTSDGDVSPNFRIAEALLGLVLPKIQVVNAEGIDRLVGKTRVVSASRFFAGLI